MPFAGGIKTGATVGWPLPAIVLFVFIVQRHTTFLDDGRATQVALKSGTLSGWT